MVKDETKVLFQQRDELSNMVKPLQGQKTVLVYKVDGLMRGQQVYFGKDTINN
jgi:DNA invertase Pin-like site-specific DNA recombinase